MQQESSTTPTLVASSALQEASTDLKSHWENVYETKADSQTSWFQEIPETSLELIEKFGSALDVSDANKTFIDVGCGNSHLSYEIIKREKVTFGEYFLIDISKAALERSRELMKALNGLERVSFIESNILKLDSVLKEEQIIDIWHDRATFHFLNSMEDQVQYLKIMCKLLKKGGYFLISTFSSNGGPTKCSGLPITQYDTGKWMKMFENVECKFELVESFEQVHTTPFNTTQNFLFCIFKKV
ncbi:predicted protein [Naegleria gruberi]|uniref:Predicted protein n=1 Tax=Naegleria gruberi TaxID=5762 RepID=D2VGE6_NAEGR|nr:uncharacterized protein NAEGRDRAFT_49327 [Naegleria gruberi]EFC44048.1 predicted protein [Naegleria gruberi]|eukprot:XP_002676792.1 predicted protein [Naegleria gruberi strain NEG-M]